MAVNLLEDDKQKLVEYRKNIMRCGKIRTKSLNRASSFSLKSKNGVILGWPRIKLLAVRVVENVQLFQGNLTRLK